MLRVKICGNRTPDDVAIALAEGADALGFICGVRYKSEDALTPEQAAALVRLVPVYVQAVLVTHLQAAAEVIRLQETVGASVIQFADSVAPSEVEAIRRALPHVSLIQAVHVTGPEAIQQASLAEPHFDALLLDSRTAERVGGTGLVHDWSISRQIVEAARKPVILAGGLNPGNLVAAIEAVRPYAVDVNSGVDNREGDKDPSLVREFLRLAKGL